MPPFQKTPMSQCTPDTPDSPSLTRLSPRVATHNTMARVTACREPEWEIPPIAKVMRKESWHMQKAWSGFRGTTWIFLSIYPPKPVCLPYCTVHSTLLTLTGVVPHHLFLENFNSELQLVSCIWKECFCSNPSDGSLTCLRGSPELLQVVIVYSPPTVRSTKLKAS